MMTILSAFELLVVLLTIVLVIQALVLLSRPWFRQRRRKAMTAPAAKVTNPAPEIFPSIPVADHATPAEQDAFLERLAALPQIRRLPDGSLMDWMSGMLLTAYDCGQDKTVSRSHSHPHLKLIWIGEKGLGMITRGGLAHYLAYQEHLAGMLLQPRGEDGVGREEGGVQ